MIIKDTQHQHDFALKVQPCTRRILGYRSLIIGLVFFHQASTPQAFSVRTPGVCERISFASTSPLCAGKADDEEDWDECLRDQQDKNLSKSKAISALSQPKEPTSSNPAVDSSKLKQQGETGQEEKGRNNDERGHKRPHASIKSGDRRYKSPGARMKEHTKSSRLDNSGGRRNGKESDRKGKASLLPPPLYNLSDDDLTSGLSSWEEFLGQSSINSPSASSRKPASQLPSISDLFPPNLVTSPSDDDKVSVDSSSPISSSAVNTTLQGMDGVLPVSELFYRSSQSLSEELEGVADDEELPFSAEQSDSLMTDGTVQVRRNQAPKRRRSRKVVRRGMEMLVGGVPINADPPQRSVELLYQPSSADWAQAITLNTRDFGPLLHQASANAVSAIERGIYCESFVHNAIKWDVCPKDMRDIVKNVHQKPHTYASLLDEVTSMATSSLQNDEDESEDFSLRDERMKEDEIMPQDHPLARDTDIDEEESSLQNPDMIFNCQFCMKVPMKELESIGVDALERVILNTIVLLAKDKLMAPDFSLDANELDLTESNDSTIISLDFHFIVDDEDEDLLPVAQSLRSMLSQTLKDGTFADVMDEVSRVDARDWPQDLQSRIILYKEVEEDEDEEDFRPSAKSFDDLFLRGGNDGAFFDYSESNIENAPFKGALGPLLLDATIERAKQRYPRVIAIGDVHGCIDELQDLLRLCDYQPGDLVVFLGDLVCKGPDSISVVQMAREIGAVGVRGNHDFEVVRWYQAIQSGVDPPVVGSEHFHIASCLSKADMNWLYSLPWYLSSKDLGALFVHAGFVAGIRLAKQNPRLMMNMRSILPDGTVTSKFFSNWPWARLWDGPQTVLFGHDADRGLQQYEHAIGLDTGCVYGGRLTACILPEKRLVSVSARREYFKYRRRHYD